MQSGILHENDFATKRHKHFVVLWLIAQPAPKRGVLDDNRLHAFGAGGDEADFGADLLGQEFDVATGVGGKRTHLCRAEG